MRFPLRALLGAALGLAGLLTPVVAGAPGAVAASAPKVVIIVGPVAGTTPEYKADSDKAAAEALKYTPNVVKLYSPNATWDKVKAALQGASIVIYMGHGNGFPSPYAATLQADREDGLGLNPTAGMDDSTTKYWGEQYLKSDIHLAPNAVVLLGHLCYASGSSEPGKADPSLSEAKQRVDNYAAGFLAAGARAVIAEAYGGATAAYVDALFTAHDTIGDIWASSFTRQGGAFSFPSTRTAGMTVQMDPDHSSGKYYRAITGDLSLSSDSVVAGGAAPSPTPTPTPTPSPSPSSAPSPSGAPAPTATPTPTATIGTPAPTPTPTATPRPTATPTPTATLAPRPTPTPTAPPAPTAPAASPTPTPPPSDDSNVQLTSQGIALTSISAPAAFSPNGDGRQDTFAIRAQLSVAATWQLTITDGSGAVEASEGGDGDTINFDWDGTAAGRHLADGTYTYRLSAGDALGGSMDRTARVRIDTTAPSLTATAPATAPGLISPNGDGQGDTWTGSYTTNEQVTADVTIRAAGGTSVRSLRAASSANILHVTWDGRNDRGAGVADGEYSVTVVARDAAGNAVTTASKLVVYRGLSAITSAPTIFYPQDHDGLAGSTRLGFSLLQPATVSWAIVNASGATVATRYAATAFQPRSVSWAWNGTDTSGHVVPAGTYTEVLTAGNGTISATVRTPLTVAAFAVVVTPNPARRGQNVTVNATSAETLASAPKLTIRQPGVAARTVTMVKVSATANTWKITTKLSSSGSAGTLGLTVAGTDTSRGVNTTTAAVPLQ